MQNIKEIFIANTAEVFADLLEQTASGNINQQDRVQQEIDLSQRGQFWGGDNKIIITPTPIPEVLFQHNIDKLGYKNIKNLWPKNPNIRLCNSVLNDLELTEALIRVFQSNKNVRISSYSVTDAYLNLLRFLKDRVAGWNVTNLPITTNPLKLVKEIDSKNGFREIVVNLFPRKNIKLPRGFICKTEDGVAKAISFFLNIGIGFVVKVHNGESGWGVKIIDNDAVQKLKENKVKDWLRELFESDLIWKFAPYIVEEFIPVDKTIGGGFPSSEGHVTDEGFVFDYNCGQEVTKEGSFEGVVLSKDTILESVNTRMRIGVEAIGNKLYDKGYRGIFDVDFTAGKDGNLYILESNARVTGGTHVYHLMSHLGIGESNLYVISNDSFCYNMQIQKPKELLARLSNVLYPVEGQKRGSIVSFVSPNRPVIGVIVIGQNKKDAHSLLQRAKDCLTEY